MRARAPAYMSATARRIAAGGSGWATGLAAYGEGTCGYCQFCGGNVMASPCSWSQYPNHAYCRHVLRPGAEGAGQDSDAIACPGLGEDGLKVILDRVLGQGHLPGQRPGIAASCQQGEQFAFPGGEAGRAREEVEAVSGGRFLD